MAEPSSNSSASIGRCIRVIRGHKVVLDTDLATLYGVTTFRFNEAIKRNADRFPEDFRFQLSREELVQLAAHKQSMHPDVVGKKTDGGNSSQIAMSSRRHRGAAYLPWAFTEHGALMAANILRSARAAEMSIFVIRAFVRMREELATNTDILRRLAEIDQTLLVHDSALRDLYQKLRPLLTPAAEPERPRIGFRP
jgi:hypothetical protein